MKKSFDPSRLAMVRTGAPKRERIRPFVAFDFETTRIPRTKTDPMRVDLKYLTAFADDYFHNTPLHFSREVRTHEHLAGILDEHFFTQERHGTRFIAWNANRFDYRPIVEVLVQYMPHLIACPYQANAGGLRGLRIVHRETGDTWEITDGIAMTGCAGWGLKKFLKVFAPDTEKHELDLEKTEFDPRDPTHVAYAERDAEGLYRAMCRVDTILRDLTGRGLQVTIGNLGIKFFQSQLPEGVKIWKAHERCGEMLRAFGIRGGFTYTKRQYDGSLWTYDRNQEYAHIMRSQRLPCGKAWETREEATGMLGAYFCTIGYPGGAPIPFYCASITKYDDRLEAVKNAFTGREPIYTFIMSSEVDMLRAHGWSVAIDHGWYWDNTFSMREMVDSLEAKRSEERGCGLPAERCECPKDAVGTLVKALGNHSFGKTLERTHDERIVLSLADPSDDETHYAPWRPANVTINPETLTEDDDWSCYWFTHEEGTEKIYHRPQVGAFITAGARNDLYTLAMLHPTAFVKCDTDSVGFDRPIPELEAQLHPTRYGAMKKETNGDRVIVLGKKGYFNVTTQEARCKGLNVRKLTQGDFERWYRNGEPPEQEQIQTISWKRGVGPASAQYRAQTRKGTDYRRTAPETISSPSA